MIRNPSDRCINDRRRGFTLVEILVVIGLILFLMSISLAAIGNSLAIARQKATQATILKIHGLVQQRVEAMNRALDTMNLQPAMDKMRRDLGVSKIGNSNVYTILVKKQIYQTRFPQSFYERNFTYINSTYIQNYNPTAHQQITESAALLYWVLTKSEIYGIAPVDESEFSSSEVRDTDGDGLLEFVDAWGHPLRFYRWPTSLFRPGSASVAPGVPGATTPIGLTAINRTYVTALWSGLPAPPTANGALDPLSRDPDDPTGELSRFILNSYSPASVMTFVQNRFHTPDTYQAFLIMSAGPDNVLGVGEPYDFSGNLGSPAPDGFVANPTGATTGSYPLTSSSPVLGLPSISPPYGQGRLAALLSYNPIETNPINDNLTNRKR